MWKQYHTNPTKDNFPITERRNHTSIQHIPNTIYRTMGIRRILYLRIMHHIHHNPINHTNTQGNKENH